MMLELRNVSRRYRMGEVDVLALDQVSFEAREGEFIAVVGPSGSGKSTLLNLAGLLDVPSEGMVLLNGRDVSNLTESERTRLRLETIGFIFQRFHLVSIFTAIENVALPMEVLGVPTAERFRRSRELLEVVGLGNRLDFPPSRLSGGERQRVAICRALANQPEIVLADEPTGELHSEDKHRIIDLFEQLHRGGHTFIMVTHDEEMARTAHRRLEMRDGRIVKEIRVDPDAPAVSSTAATPL
jgi:ABC-type lipoprotein export system ATPase subunit